MYIIKNALRNIVRTKVRNILIGIIVIIIAVASCIALSISNSASELVKNQKDLNSIKATITVDNEKMRESMKEQMSQGSSDSDSGEQTRPSFSFDRPELTVDEIKTYGASKYVDSYSYYLTSSVDSTTIDPYSTSTSSDDSSSSTTSSSSSSEAKTSPDGKEMGGGGMMSRGDFTITGYSDQSSMTDFIDGTSKITHGAMFDADETGNVCVISSEVAILNDLSVGSSITFDNPQNEDETFTMKVVGIYETESTDTTNNFMQNANNPVNEIITNYTALNKIVAASETAAQADTSTTDDSTDSQEATRSTALSGQLTSYFVVEDEEALENFKTDLTDMGLSDDFTVTSDLDTVEQTLEPIENMESFAKIFLLVVLIVGGGILVILNMINIRERKYEIGVLTAIGMKKGKVAMQFVCELFAVTLVSIIIGTSIGAVASVPVASKLLESQISSQTSSTQQVSENFGKSGSTDMPQGQSGGGRGDNGGGMGTMMSSRSNVKYVDQINAAVNIPVLLELLAIGIFLTLLSGSVALIAISRYSPLKILSSRT